MAEATLIKSIRIEQPDEPRTDFGGVKLTLYSKRKKKWAEVESPNNFNPNPDSPEPFKLDEYPIGYTDEEVIKNSLNSLSNTNTWRSYLVKNNFSSLKVPKIVQDPWKENPPEERHYGFTYYYLNDGSQVHIEWIQSGQYAIGSKKDNADELNSVTKRVKYLPYSKDNGTSGLPPELKDQSDVPAKWSTMYLDKNTDSFNSSDKVEFSNQTQFSSTFKDSDIIKNVLSILKRQISSYTNQGIDQIKLDLCDPDTEYCKLIKYVDFLSEKKPQEETPAAATQSTPPPDKTKIIIELPSDMKVKVKDDMPTIRLLIGTASTSPNAINNNTGDGNEDFIDPEYTESGYQGEEETSLTQQEWKEQEKASKQEDSTKLETAPGPPADIKPVSSFDALLNLAEKCARELGKNPRVNAENMKLSYKEGIHGLCPQGTQAVMYALTGIKAVGSVMGNADWFSFKSPTRPAGGDNRGDFSKTGYYNPKVKISQINGSWKGTYLDKREKSQWQIGDVVAMGYSTKSYGHIQVWTGYSWMSDFKQGDAIQQNFVDPESVALWRLNSAGIAAVQKQSGGKLA